LLGEAHVLEIIAELMVTSDRPAITVAEVTSAS